MPWQDDPANDGVALRDKFTQYQLRSHGIQLFIQYSAYRLSPESFLAIGLVGRSVLAQARERLKECSWVPQGADPSDATRRIKGTVTLLEGTEHHNLDYGVLQVTCTLERLVPPATDHIGNASPGPRALLWTQATASWLLLGERREACCFPWANLVFFVLSQALQ